VRPAIEAEKLGIPSVTVAASSFLSLVQLLGKEEGVPGQAYAEYTGTLSVETEKVIRENLKKVTFEQILQALTGPVQKAGQAVGLASLQEKVILNGSFQEIGDSFYENGLTDGLAIIPPTRARVEEFLRYTDRAPDETIAVLPPANLRVTPVGIAANAVMAGARPEHMPVLIAAVEAIAAPHYNLEQIGTTGGLNQFLLLNGPIVKQLGIPHDIGLASRGPNPAIGRAFGLILRNVAGFRPGEQYMGTFGYFLPFVLAENEDDSPWEPFHVQHGFDRNVSTVTAGGTFNWGGQTFPSGTDPEGLLKSICAEIVRHVIIMATCQFGPVQMMTVLITPSVAKAIAGAGYSKRDVLKYFFEHSRVTARELSFEVKYGWGTGAGVTLAQVVEEGWGMPKEWAKLGPDDTVPVMAYPETIHAVVCGDLTRNKAMTLHGVYNRPSTKEIRLPANWDHLI
jgi:hypothetical protein